MDDCGNSNRAVAFGLVSSYTLGGFIHILLVIAIIVVLLNIIQGRKAL